MFYFFTLDESIIEIKNMLFDPMIPWKKIILNKNFDMIKI